MLAAFVAARPAARPGPGQLMPRRPARAGRSAGRPGGPARGAVRATLAGNAELLADRRVRGLLLAQWLPGAFLAGAESLIVPYTESLGHPAAAASPLLAAVPAGMLAVTWSSAGSAVRPCGGGWSCRWPWPPGRRCWCCCCTRPGSVVAAVLFGCGFGFGYQLGIQQAFLDSLPPGPARAGFRPAAPPG